jgi:hypothetical protein
MLGVQKPTKGTQHRVDTSTVSLVVLIDDLPLSFANWTDHRSVFSAPSRWSQKRVSQPAKNELVLHTKMNLNRIKIQLTSS